MDDCNKAIEINPEFAAAYENRGFLKLRQGQDAEAQRDFDKLFELKPEKRPAVEKAIQIVIRQRSKTPTTESKTSP